MFTRRLPTALPVLLAACATTTSPLPAPRPAPPNVVIVITDDQGIGDFGVMGNPILRTPHLDALSARSAQVETFYVHPVCAPTRASLMTGRYCQRTRAFDTYIGRAMMEPAEVTIAESLRDAGWATGLFGKWHLGDCYPMRPQDQGFDEVLMHRGGGIGQPSDPPSGARKYTDPVLFRNGEEVALEGYCTDLYFDAAFEFMRARSAADEPFFAYVATNAPHGPFHDVPEELYDYYKTLDLSPGAFPEGEGFALPATNDQDRLARIFAMIENVDQNVGRLFATLEELGELENTLVIFLDDNGPNTRRYVRGMRGMKSEVYEGGVRSPFFAHWPARLDPETRVREFGADIDVLPTVLDACGVAVPDGVDGRSLLPLLDGSRTTWPDRAVVIQAHRGDEPLPYHNAMVRRRRWKLVSPSGFGRELQSLEPQFELYDMRDDPLERQDIAARHPSVVGSLRTDYDEWWDDIVATRADTFAPPRIRLGGPAPDEVVLTRQDWRRVGEPGAWGGRSRGQWLLHVDEAGTYRVRLSFLPKVQPTQALLRIGEAEWTRAVEPDQRELVFGRITLPAGETALYTELEDSEGRSGAYQVFVEGPR